MFDTDTIAALAYSVLAVAAIAGALTVVAVTTLVRDHRAAATPRVVTVTRQSQVELQRAA